MKGTRLRKIRYFSAAVVLSAFAAIFAACIVTKSAAVMIYPGDLDLNHEVNVNDGVMLARSCAEDRELVLSDESKRNADVNQDSTVNQADLIVLIRQLAGLEPIAEPFNDDPTETTTTETTTTTSATTETTTTTTSAETTTTTTETEETTTTTTTTAPVIPDSVVLTVDDRTLPLDVSMSVLTGDKTPNELLTVQYTDCNMTFAIYADDPLHTMIGISANDLLVGYYAIGSGYTAPNGYTTVEYMDKHSSGTGELYAVLVMKNGYSIKFGKIMDQNNLAVMAKLNYYAVNGVRALNGLPGFTWDDKLSRAALSHSKEMADNDYFDHDSIDGTEFGDRLDKAGIDWFYCAENIDCGYTDPFSALNGWYNSESGHRKNILSNKYTNIGIGFAYNANSYYKYYGTQDFYVGWD